MTISTGCKGSCFQGNGGWRLAQWFTDSGTANGVDSRSWLLISTSVLPGATIQFNYSLPCQVGDYLAFSINDQPIAEYDCQQVKKKKSLKAFIILFLIRLPMTVLFLLLIQAFYKLLLVLHQMLLKVFLLIYNGHFGKLHRLQFLLVIVQLLVYNKTKKKNFEIFFLLIRFFFHKRELQFKEFML